ncbi:MAG: hypothetical protein NC177_10055 [Ruminococcus flavefaciens]|nr:hypothetical protein [Ruminococcus flavefaciens]
MNKLKKFFKDTWKPLLVIFIVVATLLYGLIFDGSEIPFLVAFMSAFVILFLKNLIPTILFAKKFSYLKKTGFFTGDERSQEIYKQCAETTHANIFFTLLSGAWLVYLIISLTGVGDFI